MKTIKKILLAVILLSINSSYSQLATLPPSICESYKSIGWIIFNPSSISTGELFTTYYSHFFSDPNNTMVLDRSWHDNFINLDHKHYSQYYNGIRVEGRGFSEHFDGNGDIEYANGKICSEIGNVSTSNIIGSESALDSILANYEYNQWSWDSPEFEAQYKADLEDSLATSYPMGELVFALKSWDIPIEYNQDENDYRLAWKFEIQSLLPSFHVSVYVDAVTGEVLKIYDNVKHDGIADVPFHGAQTIDTRWLGFPTNKHVLHTNDAGRNVHSKYDGALSWGLTSEVKDADGTWGTSEQGATAAHWSVTKAWDYFKNTHDRDGLDGSGGKVRVLCESTDKVGAWYEKIGGIDRVFCGI